MGAKLTGDELEMVNCVNLVGLHYSRCVCEGIFIFKLVYF